MPSVVGKITKGAAFTGLIDSADVAGDAASNVLPDNTVQLTNITQHCIDTSAGAGDAGKPIKLDASGQVDASMINDADIDHANLTNVTPDQHHTKLHALDHVNGTDDIQNASATQKGLATATQIAKLDGITPGADITNEITVTAALPVSDATSLVKSSSDATKQVKINANAIASGQTKNIVMANRDIDFKAGGTFAESSHTHSALDITTGQLSLARGGANADLSSAPSSELIQMNVAGTALEGSGKTVNDFISKTIVDTLGDIVVADGPDSVIRVGIGANDQVLTADYTQPGGVKWADASGGNSFSTITGDSGSAIADSSSDSLKVAGGTGITTSVTDNPETVTINHDAHTGDVTGSTALTIGTDKVLTNHILNGAITLAKMADVVQDRIIGRATASTGAPEAITAQQVLDMINSVATGQLSLARGGANVDLSSISSQELIQMNLARTALEGSGKTINDLDSWQHHITIQSPTAADELQLSPLFNRPATIIKLRAETDGDTVTFDLVKRVLGSTFTSTGQIVMQANIQATIFGTTTKSFTDSSLSNAQMVADITSITGTPGWLKISVNGRFD